MLARHRGVIGWTRSLVMLTSALACLVVAEPARAEWFADLYLGGAFTEKHDVTADFGGGFQVKTLDVSFDKSFAGGIRGGYWFPFELGPVNFGTGLDLSHFSPNIGRQQRVVCANNVCANGVFEDLDLSVWTVAIDLLFRFPLLKSASFPKGQLQPYITVGPAIFVANAEDSHNFQPPRQSNSDTTLGVKVGAGVMWYFTPVIAMFGEYRWTHFHPDFTIAGVSDLTTDINTHYVLVGVSFHF